MGFYLAGFVGGVALAALAYAGTKWLINGRPVLPVEHESRPVEWA